MIKKLLIGFAVLLPILYMLAFKLAALVIIAIVAGLLLLAYAIGDILLMEYYRWK